MDTNQAPGYVDAHYLQSAATLLQPIKARSYELLRIAPGQRLLDVGCGPGLDSLALGRLVGPEGCVVGVDADASMVALASQRAEQEGVADRVSHQQADAYDLPLDSAAFDGARSERLFIHLQTPLLALEEMVRVVRPGGWVVVIDSDWGSLSIDTELTEIERRLARFRAEQLLNNGYSGRQLLRLFIACGLQDVELEVWPVVIRGDSRLARYLTKLDEVERCALESGCLTVTELEAWRAELNRAQLGGTFFAAMNMVAVAGRRG